MRNDSACPLITFIFTVRCSVIAFQPRSNQTSNALQPRSNQTSMRFNRASISPLSSSQFFFSISKMIHSPFFSRLPFPLRPTVTQTSSKSGRQYQTCCWSPRLFSTGKQRVERVDEQKKMGSARRLLASEQSIHMIDKR